MKNPSSGSLGWEEGMIRLNRELFSFMATRKQLRLFPIIHLFLLLGAETVLPQGSALAPIIYTHF